MKKSKLLIPSSLVLVSGLLWHRYCNYEGKSRKKHQEENPQGNLQEEKLKEQKLQGGKQLKAKNSKQKQQGEKLQSQK